MVLMTEVVIPADKRELSSVSTSALPDNINHITGLIKQRPEAKVCSTIQHNALQHRQPANY